MLLKPNTKGQKGEGKVNIVNRKEYQDYIDKQKGDPYGLGVFSYAERWADMMEIEMSTGKEIKDIAKELSFKADTEGITGFMYGCAVNVLAQHWEHGEELRRWHNGNYGHEGDGVVNPAIITLKKVSEE